VLQEFFVYCSLTVAKMQVWDLEIVFYQSVADVCRTSLLSDGDAEVDNIRVRPFHSYIISNSNTF